MADLFPAGQPASSSVDHPNNVTQSEWLGFPSMGVPEVDELGFWEVAGRIGEPAAYRMATEINIGCSRAAAILRQASQGFPEKVLSDQQREDLAYLVDTALECVPEQDADKLGDCISRGNAAAEKTVWHLMKEGAALRLMLKAMAVAGRADATLEEVRVAATTAHCCASQLPDGAGQMQAFGALLESRGLFVHWLDMGEKFPPMPDVHASAAEFKKFKRRWAKEAPWLGELCKRLNEPHEKAVSAVVAAP